MSESSTRQLNYFPNKISRILLMAMHKVIGDNGMYAVLNTARLQHLVGRYPEPNFEPGLTFDETGRLFQSIEGIYGIRGGRRLSQQIGHVCFQYGIDGFGGFIGFADFLLRLLPMSMRVHIGIEVLAEILNLYSNCHVVLGEDDDNYLFILDRSGISWGRHTEEPSCHLMVGLLEESLYWVSRGRRFLVEETSCMASGDPMCIIRVDKKVSS